MKTHTNAFKTNIKDLGRQIDVKVTYDNTTLGNEEINSLNYNYKGDILKSVMKQLEIDSNVNIPLKTQINVQIGLLVGNNYEYLNYGSFIVEKAEKQEDKDSYILTCYDLMLNAMVPYEDVGVTYPITIRDYIDAICTKLGLTFASSSDNFVNYDKQITNELYLDSDGNSLDYTFRDVLDELAQVTASTICINDDDELEVRYIKETSPLPSGYQQVEYIESTGTQYINTGINPTLNTGVKIKASLTTENNTDKVLFGSRVSGNRYWFDFDGNHTPPRFIYGFGNYYQAGAYSLNTDYEISFNYNGEKKLIINDNTYSMSGTPDYSNSVPIYLFRGNYSNAYVGNFKIYYCQIYDGTTLVRDYIPCIRKNDNAVGMYDLVNDTFYTNQGTGTFGKGNVVCDTIDEEYLKNINVNFGEKYGAINTIVLSRSADSDKISLSIPEDLDDDLKVPIQISDNQILNSNDRDAYMVEILNKLYGLEFYINDYASTGILYYDLCDRYNVKIGNNTYNCVMLNDEINVSNGLVENIYTELPETSEQDYTKMDKTDRRINQTYLIVDKQNGQIESLVSRTNTLEVTENNNYQELQSKFDGYALQSDVITLETSVSQLQTDTYTKTEINTKLTDGSVTKVQTTSGTFDESGMRYEKTNAKTSCLINERGVEVDSTSSNTELLFAGYDENKNQTIVRTENLNVNRYLVIGKNSRMEDYGNGGGMFTL